MIVRYLPGRTLVDREAASALLDRPVATIRALCAPVACDLATRRVLYDYERVTIMNRTISRRLRHVDVSTIKRG